MSAGLSMVCVCAGRAACQYLFAPSSSTCCLHKTLHFGPRHPAEEDLQRWSHHHGVTTVNDDVLRQAGEGLVSFVFGLEVEGKDLALFAAEDEEKRRLAAVVRAPAAIGT